MKFCLEFLSVTYITCKISSFLINVNKDIKVNITYTAIFQPGHTKDSITVQPWQFNGLPFFVSVSYKL